MLKLFFCKCCVGVILTIIINNDINFVSPFLNREVVYWRSYKMLAKVIARDLGNPLRRQACRYLQPFNYDFFVQSIRCFLIIITVKGTIIPIHTSKFWLVATSKL